VDTAAAAGATGLSSYRNDGDPSDVYDRIAALDAGNDVRGSAADLGAAGSTVEFLVYDPATNEFTCESGCDPELVNAVRVTKVGGYETPVYFSWARNLLGGASPASHAINVSAAAYQSCAGEAPIGGVGVIALRECEINYPEDCNVPQVLQGGSDNSAFTTFNLTGASVCKQIVQGNPPSNLQDRIKVGDTINLVGTGQVTSCLAALDEEYQHCDATRCATDPPDPTCIIYLPVIDCTGPESNAKVVGFARTCVTDIQSQGQEKWVKGEIECEGTELEGGGGTCAGVLGKKAYLVR
ncbi:MAG: hypothetical protein ACREQJ_02050, partial [Candidatus Binatia bacterium]